MQTPNKAEYWKKRFLLEPHPEGGSFKEVYRSNESIKNEHLPSRFKGTRVFSTSIYFLLEKGEFSAFHRIRSDETWYFHDGDLLQIFVINQDGELENILLGLGESCHPQYTIKQGQWFAAISQGDYTLVSCNVSPGFNFADFELASFENLSEEFPQHHSIVRTFTR